MSGAAPSGLRQRIPTALVLLASVCLVLFAMPPDATLALILLAFLFGAWEWSAFVAPTRRGLRGAFVALIGLGVLVAWQASAQRTGLVALLVAAGLWWLLALVWILRGPQRGGAALAAVAGVAALVPTAVALGRLRGVDPQGAWVLLFSLAVIMAADVGAYFAGHRWGRLKLAPRVSPGKTWEGVIGGLAVSLLVAWGGATLLGWSKAVVLPLAFGAAAFSVVGDLMESLLKRHSGLKDSGHLLPGHGGVLDRIDSLTAGIPVFTLGLLQAGVIGTEWAPP
jgi:phosphatidate cytidylyltransferase